MRVLFHKLTDDRHAIEIVRDDARRERVECETRSSLQHDLLHYAAEGEARCHGGFWGTLAGGRTLAEMNDRNAPPSDGSAEMAMIEQVVGVLSGAVKGRTAEEVVGGLRRWTRALDREPPEWVTVAFVGAVQKRMRQLIGHWKATPFGGTMELSWPPKWASPGP
jgi:hypothetical protein